MEESTSKLFAQKIRELKGTQEGIQSECYQLFNFRISHIASLKALSHWVQFHRKKIGSIVRVWVKELGREGDLQDSILFRDSPWSRCAVRKA